MQRAIFSLTLAAATSASARNISPAFALSFLSSNRASSLITPVLLTAKIRGCYSTTAKTMSNDSNSSDRINEEVCFSSSGKDECQEVDKEYPGTAVRRMMAVRKRVIELAAGDELNGTWEEVRRKLLWAGGLKDLPNSRPGMGYTGHSFNDFNHVDLTTMNGDVENNENDGEVENIAIGNPLGSGIRIASLPELGKGGSWSTCADGCNTDPPNDVAHVQFRSRIAFKLVWVPNEKFDTFVLVDDDGKLLAKGTPSDGSEYMPSLRERKMNYQLMQGSKYATAADEIASIQIT